VVPDAARDPRFEGNPQKAAAYAGIAVPMPDGTRAGVLSVMDRKARGFTRDELEGLGDLVGWVQVELRAIREARKQETIIAERGKLRDKATIDALTQVHNRPTILEILDGELTRALRDDKPLGLVIADLDHFKRINDTHGHPAGDAVLKEAAKRMKASVRPTDAVGRYGGEEFLIVLPGASVESAARTAERIRSHVGAAAVGFGGKDIPVTVSLGVTAKAFPERVKPEQLVKAADEALYRAKTGGRNRVEITT
jgi:diguanylate cyclase (GGDEF)-like protein